MTRIRWTMSPKSTPIRWRSNVQMTSVLPNDEFFNGLCFAMRPNDDFSRKDRP